MVFMKKRSSTSSTKTLEKKVVMKVVKKVSKKPVGDEGCGGRCEEGFEEACGN